jgi:hypothetical protein
MALVDSLLSAIVRAGGDALVMHVGERPYVVVGTNTINISTHGLNLQAMTGMLGQLLPPDALTALDEFGAVEHALPQTSDDRFAVVAARGGDDIWIEIRRRRGTAAVTAAEPKPVPAPIAAAPVAAPKPKPPAPVPEPVAVAEPPVIVEAPVPVAEPEPESDPEPEPEPVPVQSVVVSEPEAVVHTTIEVVRPDEPVASAYAREEAGELRRDHAEAAFGREGGPAAPAVPAEVVPLTRTVRNEAPPKSTPAPKISNVERLLRIAAARGASSLFLASDSRPYMRVEGDMRQLDEEPVMTKAEVEGAILEIAPGGEEPASKNAPTNGSPSSPSSAASAARRSAITAAAACT